MIKVQNLHYSYPGSTSPTLHGFDFELARAEIFGFLGPSGAGKSTTQKVLTGILKNYRGSVNVLGQEISRVNRSFYEDVGVAFETPNLYTKFTASENLRLYASLFDGETIDPDALLAKVNLLADKDTRVEAFSKGMKTRLNFVRALINKPKLLFLDEPTSGLDPTNARLVKDIILELQQNGTTIFLTTHNMSVADELCHRVAFMVNGRIPRIESPSRLKQEYGHKRVIVKRGADEKAFSLKNLHTNNDFLNMLKDGIDHIETDDATLETIFIKVTGETLT